MKEHKYKAGQFLRNKSSGNICKCHADTSFIDENIWEAWEPKEGDWCWFYDKHDIKYMKSPHIGQYNNLSYSLDFYDFCEPFLNSLPSWMKN